MEANPSVLEVIPVWKVIPANIQVSGITFDILAGLIGGQPSLQAEGRKAREQ